MEIVHITKESGIPLIGCIAFGIIDRGTDLLQVRPTSVCNLHCKYCSVSANNYDIHPANFTVDKDYLIEEVEKVVKFKETECEINLDSVGELTTYAKLPELVKGLKSIKGVKSISMQTNGTLLTGDMLIALEKAGVNHINLSINSLDANLAADLSGRPGYSLDHILQIAKMIADSSIELLIAPVWIPKINDADIPKLIELAKKLNAKIGIQKYETYRYSRKIKGAKQTTFWKFYRQLKDMEKESGIKLVLTASDFLIHKTKRIPAVFEPGEKVQVNVKCPGWIKGQMIGAAKGVCVSVNDCKTPIGKNARVKILENKNSIYVAGMVK
ncbi:MAG: radical SAM protein [Candidatus Nanoarchaeia archaeon]|nr:radical SAM protein [Candidatus Nanoarchaeia archaeon]